MLADESSDEYLALPYRITLTQDADDEGHIGWVAEVEELSGCLSQGETPEEAVANVRDAMAGWISVQAGFLPIAPEAIGRVDMS